MLTAALVLLLGLSVTFLVLYALARPWWRSWEGRALVTSATGWALVSGGFLVDDHLSNVPTAAWIVIAYVAVLSATLKVWLVILSRIERDR